MKKLTGSLLAASFLMLSPLTFAAEPVQLTAAEMDGVTAGFLPGNVVWGAVDLVLDIVHLPRNMVDINADAAALSSNVRSALGI